MNNPAAITGTRAPDALQRACGALAAGECIVVPTDTVYGIAADARNPAAVALLQAVKGRGDAFPPPLLAADPQALADLADPLPDYAVRLATSWWPGGLTLIVATPRTDLSLSGQTGTVGLRVPDNDWLRDLLRLTGPLAVSSANVHERPPATNVADAAAQLGGQVALYVDGGTTPGPTPSTVVDCTGPEPVILRVGLISRDEILAAAGGTHA